ncbi:MAG TPA: hypothetical protein VGC51_04065 [Hansschlegelia sp.]
MRLSAILLLATVMALPAAASAKERRSHCRCDAAAVERVGPRDARRREVERRAWVMRHRDRSYADIDPDTPYGPIYQSQEQSMQSRYDFSAGQKANIKEYWWR